MFDYENRKIAVNLKNAIKDNNRVTKTDEEITLWIFQETKKGNDWRRDMDIVTRGHLNTETEFVWQSKTNVENSGIIKLT